MCGIAGYFGSNKISKFKISKTLNLMKNRGPDNFGLYKNEKKKNIYLLHSRLSIIDLNQRSNQPYKFKNLVMVYNGEIYNFLELKKELVSKKYSFNTKSDTEVLLKYYDCFGEKAFDKLEGMWSIAIFDIKKNELLLSRDRFGEKPLFIKKEKNGVYFGSETKYIQSLCDKRTFPDLKKCNEFLFYGYNSIFKSDNSFIKGIKVFKPSYFSKITQQNKFFFTKYWDLKKIPKIERKFSEKDALIKVKKAFLNSIKLRLRSDVKIGVFLSSGIDSNSILFFCKKYFNKNFNTFSLFDTKNSFYDESILIKKICKQNKIVNKSIDVQNINVLKLLDITTKYYNSPALTLNSLAINSLYKLASNSKTKVMFSGVGSDEIFAGYFDHFKHHIFDPENKKYFKKNDLDFNSIIKPYIRNKEYSDLKNKVKKYSRLDDMELFQDIFNKIPNKFESKKRNIFPSRLKTALYYQFEENLFPTLHNEDLNSMMYSVENRTPFLDRKLIEEIFSIPSQFFINKGKNKFLLRSIGKKTVPDIVLNKVNKQGFNASLSSIKNISLEYFIKILNSKKMKYFFNKKSINFVKSINFKSLKHSENQLLFRILSIYSFLKYYYKN